LLLPFQETLDFQLTTLLLLAVAVAVWMAVAVVLVDYAQL
jgi:hypothetical protein